MTDVMGLIIPAHVLLILVIMRLGMKTQKILNEKIRINNSFLVLIYHHWMNMNTKRRKMHRQMMGIVILKRRKTIKMLSLMVMIKILEL